MIAFAQISGRELIPCKEVEGFVGDGGIDEGGLDCFELAGQPAGTLQFGARSVPVRNGIPRFTPDGACTDNFALLRVKHARCSSIRSTARGSTWHAPTSAPVVHAWSLKFDRPLSAASMRANAASCLKRRFEVVDDRTVTLLRTVLD